MTWNSTRLLSYGLCSSEVQVQLNWVLCSVLLKAEIKASHGLPCFLKFGVFFHAPWCSLLKSGPCSWGTEGPVRVAVRLASASALKGPNLLPGSLLLPQSSLSGEAHVLLRGGPGPVKG